MMIDFNITSTQPQEMIMAEQVLAQMIYQEKTMTQTPQDMNARNVTQSIAAPQNANLGV